TAKRIATLSWLERGVSAVFKFIASSYFVGAAQLCGQPLHDFKTARLTINGLLSERPYSSSKRLIVRHKVLQQREQFCRPLDDLAFQFTALDQFNLPVG